MDYTITKSERLTRHLQVRISESDFEKLRIVAEKAGITTADLIRQVVQQVNAQRLTSKEQE